MIKKIIFLFIAFFISNYTVSAQFGASSELGVIAGPTFFQSDYGERYDVGTNFANNGFAIGLVHWTNFSYNYQESGYNRQSFFNDHFKLRTELSFQKADFIHKGRWVEGVSNIGKEQLRAMRGSSAITNVGMQFDYFFSSIYNNDTRTAEYNFAPYLSFGAQYSFFTSKSTSTLGAVDNSAVTFEKYLGRSRSESSTVFSLVSSVGARYKIGDFDAISLDLRWQYYFSDWVDGLNPDRITYPENKSNDMSFWVNVGYIYHFQ